MTAFRSRFGFDRTSVNLFNWRQRPYSRWSFQNASELVPGASIRAKGDRSDLPVRVEPGLPDIPIAIGDETISIADFLDRSQTDRFLWWRGGRLLADFAAPSADRDSLHLVFSISKSITGILAGILHDRGGLDPSRNVSAYLPREYDAVFSGASVQDLLDMKVSLRFSEAYLDRQGDYARYRRAMLWDPPVANEPEENLSRMLSGLRKGSGEHGRNFHYHSPVSDVLGLVIEAASGARFNELMSELLWRPLGARQDAQVTVDAAGTARTAGGISVAAEDLLLVGKMLLEGGSVDGRQVVSERWIDDMRTMGDDAAWRNGNYWDFVVGGRYRNQWYQMPRSEDIFFAVGIHGQWLYVDREGGNIFVRLSSQAEPQSDVIDQNILCFFKHLSTFAG